jgi:multidrug efflux pump subunit AcrB
VPVDDVFSTLQAAFGSIYVNDFDRAGRVYRVQVQAEPQFRSRPEDLRRIWVRSDNDEMVPLGSLIDLEYEGGAETIERFNLYPSIKLLGAPAPGRSSSEAIAAVEELALAKLPPGYGVAWTGSAYEEKKSGATSFLVLALGMVFAFLILSAQYERWSLPFAVLLGVPFALVGALFAVWARGMANDIYFQIGLVTLIGLAAKNAILIVEFAAQRREAGDSILEAATNAARLRFRPIVMTSLAFILGVLPLALATGAGAGARRSMGTGVLGGMLFATLVGVLFIPLFFRWVSGRERKVPAPDEADEVAQAEPGSAS